MERAEPIREADEVGARGLHHDLPFSRDLDPPLRLEEVPVGFEGDALSLWKVRVS